MRAVGQDRAGDLELGSVCKLLEIQLFEAIRTLAALPDREARWLKDQRAHWPETLREVWEEFSNAVDAGAFEAMRARAAAPTPAAIDRMIPTLLLLRHVGARERRVIWMRAFGVSWWKIGAKFRRGEGSARKWYAEALAEIARRT